MQVLEYRLKTRLPRGYALTIGAALTSAGVAGCTESTPMYGAPPCPPMACPVGGGGSAGETNGNDEAAATAAGGVASAGAGTTSAGGGGSK
jgi:hypothetical protein